MRRAAHLLAGSLSVGAVVLSLGCLSAALGPAATATGGQARSAPHARPLTVTIDSVSPRLLKASRPLSLSGTLTNPGTATWTDAVAYLQISPTPATTQSGLEEFASVPATQGYGSTIYSYGLFTTVGNVSGGESVPFTVSVPFADLPIDDDAGVYRVGVKVVAGLDGVRNPNGVHASTLVTMLPDDKSALSDIQTVTLLPIAARVPRIDGGAFADDSLDRLISFGGRLYNLLLWALQSPDDSLQVALDPALLTAVQTMAHGYRVLAPGTLAQSNPAHGRPPPLLTTAGTGVAAAQSWLSSLRQLIRQQQVLLLPWGAPAGNALMASGLRGPLAAAVNASLDYQQDTHVGDGVLGWLPGGSLGGQALTVLRQTQPELIAASAASLPGLSSPAPAAVQVSLGGRWFPILVTSRQIAAIPTASDTSALQVRQRLIAEATVRAMSGTGREVFATALPADWDPGIKGETAPITGALSLPFLSPVSALGALTQQPVRHLFQYRGRILPSGGKAPKLTARLSADIRALHGAAGTLASIISPQHTAEIDFQRELAMAGSSGWLSHPTMGARLVERATAVASAALARVTVTGPPLVAMSSSSGRFPITVTNGLSQAISVQLSVVPADRAVRVSPIAPVRLAAGQRRDIQVQTTARGSGVTSVQARLATPTNVLFGKAWTFDVRATEIGLVIWVVMAVGAFVLLVASAYRIAKRIRSGGFRSRRVPSQ